MSGTVTRTEAVACDRGDLNTGIVHFGVGGFHRSHQQVSFVSEFTRFGNVRADPARGGAPNATVPEILPDIRRLDATTHRL